MKKLLTILCLVLAMLFCFANVVADEAADQTITDQGHPIDEEGKVVHDFSVALNAALGQTSSGDNFTIIWSKDVAENGYVTLKCAYATEDDYNDFETRPIYSDHTKHNYPKITTVDEIKKAVADGFLTVKTPATCTANAILELKCDDAGKGIYFGTEKGQDPGYLYGHKKCDAKQTVDATTLLDIKGVKAAFPEWVATGHAKEGSDNYKLEIVTAPTCTEAGYAKAVCTNKIGDKECGEILKIVELPATGHDVTLTKTKLLSKANCTEYAKYEETCAVCKAKVAVEDKEAGYDLTKDGHDWGEWQVRIAPTCEEKGLSYRLCKRCLNVNGSGNDEKITDALGHKWAFDWVKEPNCKEDGTAKSAKCSVCGKKMTTDNAPENCTVNADGTITVKADGVSHPSKYFVKAEEQGDAVAPTCTKAGTVIFNCELCGTKNIAVKVDALGHKMKTEYREKGTTEPIYAQKDLVCGKVYEVRTICENDCDLSNPDKTAAAKWTEIKPLEHQWGEWIEQNPASDKTPGYWIRTCKICSEHEEVIGYDDPRGEQPDPVDPVDPVDPDDPVDPEPEKDPEYKATDGKFDADEMMVSGKVEHVDGTGEAEKLYARITFFMADGTFTVTTAPVVDGAYEAMNSGDIIHIAVQVTNTNKVKPGEFNSYGSQEFDVE